MSIPHTRVVFRVGDEDARKLQSGFTDFQARDLQNLGIGEAICRVERSDFDFNLTVPRVPEPDETQEAQTRQRVITASRTKYATPRDVVEAALRDTFESQTSQPPKARRTTPSAPTSSEPQPPPEPAGVQNVAKPEEDEDADVSLEPSTLASSDEPAETGDFHEDAKRQIAAEATALDYTVGEERPVLEGTGQVDLVLERGGRRIACEICATSTASQEVAHAEHRLQAGFTDVAIVCRSPLRLSRIQQKVASALPPTQANRVGCYQVAEFIAQLREWALQDPAGGQAERAKPRKRAIQLGSNLSGEERSRQERAWLDDIARAMKGGTENPS
jgi:hypothetical protein